MPVPKGSVLRVKNSTRDGESDTASIRVSVLSRSLHSKRNITPTRDRSSDVASSSASVYSARSTFSTAPNSVRRSTMAGNVKNTLNATSRANLRKVSSPDPRPDSKLTPASDASRLMNSRTPSPVRNSTIMEPENHEGALEEKNVKDDANETSSEPGDTHADGQARIDDDDVRDVDANSDASSMISTISVKKTLINRIVIPPSVSSNAARTVRRNGGIMSRTSTLPSEATGSLPSLRPKSSASSIRSTTSTLRKVPGPSSLRPSPGRQGAPPLKSTASSRPTSSVSTNSTSENTTYKTASTYSSTSSAVTARSRRLSATSSLSVRTAGAGGSSGGALPSSTASSPVHLTTGSVTRARRSSGASLHSVNKNAHANGRSVSGGSADRKRPATHVGSSSITQKPSLSLSTKSTASGSSQGSTKDDKVKAGRIRNTSSTSKSSGPAQRKEAKSASTSSENHPDQHRKSGSTTSTATLKSRKSTETITTKIKSSEEKSPVSSKDTSPTTISSPTKEALSLVPRGIMLEVGIPCIISSQRKRFKAYARYIGEVEGEHGSWVGVEVPMGSSDSWSWTVEREEGNGNDSGRQWHDGSWGGIRYFDIGGVGSEWGGPEDRSRKRRMGGSINRKFEGRKSRVTTDNFDRTGPRNEEVSECESRAV